ncbi:hypothetical protein [Collimonas silvisoli]|uniref:hypothetical protein n=1 Tax=Collimonas silvisoli TaxID=2825884 RepID=UPI001B8C80F8|nr:hypothetical protein [Collimonas silvisoli]
MQFTSAELLSLFTWVVSAFGGWTILVSAFVYYLADRMTKRAIQNEGAAISRALATLGHELKLRESSYAKHVDLLLKYYSIFYRHYRLCQNVVNQDALKQPDGTIIKTKDVFFDQLEALLIEFREGEGRIRLVLPEHLLSIHEDSIAAFNDFKNAIKSDIYDDKYHRDIREAFARVIEVKRTMEDGLREFFRTEHLLRLEK